jgi:hypothetical protein
MKHRMIFLFLVLASLILCPSYLAAQSGFPPPPPPCCYDDSVPPPPLTITSTLPGAETTGTMPEISISEASLSAAGLTRSEFLDRIAVALFADKTTDLFIPFVIQTTDSTSVATDVIVKTASDDGAVESSGVLFLQIRRNLVTSEVMDTLDFLYLTDGQVCIKVVFLRDAFASK